MSKTAISPKTKMMLWGKAAGRCQYEGCNDLLDLDLVTKSGMNASYIAHIYGDQRLGPRYHQELSVKLAKDISNLMLLCDRHHRLVDVEQEADHPAERLFAMKASHERRIEIVTAITPEQQSHIILFGANIGQHQVPLNYRDAAAAMLPLRYPANTTAIELGIKNLSVSDHTPGYWDVQEKQLLDMFERQIAPLKGNSPVQHFSVFGLAPMPLLVRLGTLLCDIYPADIYQRHREPAGWAWRPHTGQHHFILRQPADDSNSPVLKLSLSGHISDERVRSVMNGPCSIWEITVNDPGNDFLRSKELLSEFRTLCRKVYDLIKIKHGQQALLHVFPAMPVSAAVEFGRTRMPKADLPMLLYDQNKVNNSFVPTIKII
jgi:hypothetical protein